MNFLGFCFDFHFFLSKKFSNWVASLVSCCSFKNLFLSSSLFRFSLSFEALKVVRLSRFKKIFTLWRFPLNYIDADSIGPTSRFFEGFWEKYFSLKLDLKNLHTVNVFIFPLFLMLPLSFFFFGFVLSKLLVSQNLQNLYPQIFAFLFPFRLFTKKSRTSLSSLNFWCRLFYLIYLSIRELISRDFSKEI